MSEFDSKLHRLQAEVLCPQIQLEHSLVRLYHDISSESHSVVQLHELVEGLDDVGKNELPFKMLENCYLRIRINQNSGDRDGCEYLVRLFFDCLQYI